MKYEIRITPYPKYVCHTCKQLGLDDTVRRDTFTYYAGNVWRYRCENCGENTGWHLTNREAQNSWAINWVEKEQMLKAISNHPNKAELVEWIHGGKSPNFTED